MKSENWLLKNNDERVVDYEHLPIGEHVIKDKNDTGIDEMKEVESSCSRIVKGFWTSLFTK